MKRRDFIKNTGAVIATGALFGLEGCSDDEAARTDAGPTPDGGSPSDAGQALDASSDAGMADAASPSGPPNVLFIVLDQYRLPPSYSSGGVKSDLREVLAFDTELSASNSYSRYFEGLLRMRKNGVVLRNHFIASAACTPSRASLFTGVFPSVHGMTETDAMFKDIEDPRFPKLDPAGVPTLGDWFRAGGYSTHYFGKWHMSHPKEGDLEPWGFADGERSYPEPHGADPNNLGIYRDPGFADLLSEFLETKGAEQRSGTATTPWLAVACLVNPHDIVGYPQPWWSSVQDPPTMIPRPRPIPDHGDVSNPPTDEKGKPIGTGVDLNPDGFPQECFDPSPTQNEDLSKKPDCHLDYSYKSGLVLKMQWPAQLRGLSPFPFQLQDEAEEWQVKANQFFTYLHYLVDLQVRRILDTLDAQGLTENTIVVLTSDHGEIGSAHGGMIQKWHVAYDEVMRVPFVVSSPRINTSESNLREVTALTSHVDIIPTLLGLAGLSVGDLESRIEGHSVQPLAGSNVAPVIAAETSIVNGPDGSPREAVLFTADDTISETYDTKNPPDNYADFLAEVEALKADGVPVVSGPVVQPNHIECLRTAQWKYARYFDPSGEKSDQWELYSLANDTAEATNLVTWSSDGTPSVRTDIDSTIASWGMTRDSVEKERARLHALLDSQRSQILRR